MAFVLTVFFLLNPGATFTASEWGTTTRIDSDEGPVHLWMPAGYQGKRAQVVVYVHGLFIDADGAMVRHQLPEQFAQSGRNALFIVPEAPSQAGDSPRWASLPALLALGRRQVQSAGMTAPDSNASVVLLGHSGAYRTLVNWLPDPRVHELILMDALYGNEDEFAGWIADPKAQGRSLVLVVQNTRRWAEPFVKRFPRVIILPQIPDVWTAPQIRARLLYATSQWSHMDLVETPGAIARLLQRTNPVANSGRKLAKPLPSSTIKR